MDRPRLLKRAYNEEERRRHVEAYFASGLSKAAYCLKHPDLPYTTLSSWVQAYERAGPEALIAPTQFQRKGSKCRRGRKEIPAALKDEIKKAKQENPRAGARKIRDFLARFRGVKVAPNTVQKTLKSENLHLSPAKKRRRSVRPKKVRRFERARAMQLWQSDITSFLLSRRSARVYLTVFMDDYSRYIVAWDLQLRQNADLVIDSVLRGIERFGSPEEILTDQGRQYYAWRGKTDFEKLLRQKGIKHVVARSHHPQTVGKCERFWDTVSMEFWEVVRPQDLADAKERFQHFINYYNHFRPHQSLKGLVPADRFFGLESELRNALERTYSENELKLATGEKPRTPVFLIGQIGDQRITLHGEEGQLVFNNANGERKEIPYDKFGHRRGEEGAQANGPEGEALQGAEAGDPGEGALAERDGAGPAEGARDGHGDDGVLAREDLEGAGGETAGDPADPSLAAVSEGDLGYAGGATDTAENQGSDDEPERRSDFTEEENYRARGEGEDAGGVGADPQADAGNLRGEEE